MIKMNSRVSNLLSVKLERRTVAVILLLSLIMLLAIDLRFGAVTMTVVDRPLRSDAKDYVLYVYNLKQHQVYSQSPVGYLGTGTPPPDAVRTPGYPLFLTLFINDMGPDEVRKAAMTQAALSSLTIVLFFMICSVFMPIGWALGVATLMTISPHLVNANIYLLSETLFTLMLALALGATILAFRARSHWPWLAVGVLFAAAALVRPVMQYFPAVLVGLLFFCLPRQRFAPAVAMFLAGFMLLYGIWLLRNLLVIGQMSDSYLMINFLHHGMYPGFMYEGNPETMGYPYHADPRSAVITQSIGTVLEEIWRRFLAQPAEMLDWFLLGKPVMLWSWHNLAQGSGESFIYPVLKTPYAVLPEFWFTHWVSWVLHWPVVLCAVIGGFISWLPVVSRRLGPDGVFLLRLFTLLFLYVTGIHMVGAPFPRYGIPFRPVLYGMAMAMLWLLAACTWFWLKKLLPARKVLPGSVG
jgi:hypothetical protein